MTLIAAGEAPLSVRVAQEPAVVTMADRLQEVPQAASAPFVAALAQDAEARAAFLTALDAREAALDLTDGVRMTLEGGGVVHIRPSGNAPELRLYVEAAARPEAETRLAAGLAVLRQRLVDL